MVLKTKHELQLLSGDHVVKSYRLRWDAEGWRRSAAKAMAEHRKDSTGSTTEPASEFDVQMRTRS